MEQSRFIVFVSEREAGVFKDKDGREVSYQAAIKLNVVDTTSAKVQQLSIPQRYWDAFVESMLAAIDAYKTH